MAKSYLGNLAELEKNAKKIGKLEKTSLDNPRTKKTDFTPIKRGENVLEVERVYDNNGRVSLLMNCPESKEKTFIYLGDLSKNQKEEYERIMQGIYVLTGEEYDADNWVKYFTKYLGNNGEGLKGKRTKAFVKRTPIFKKVDGELCLQVFKNTENAKTVEIRGYEKSFLPVDSLEKELLTDLKFDNDSELFVKKESYTLVKEPKIGVVTEPYVNLKDCSMLDDVIEKVAEKIQNETVVTEEDDCPF